ncbi:MAG TPA: phosphotransferase, partial [Bacteroidales bacterium]|nr:phosphotransferase [Bacteroidales bacterium]
MEILELLIKKWCGKNSYAVKPLKQAGSNRRYFRITCNKTSVIGVVNDNVAENQAFIYFSRHFRNKGVNVPEIYLVSADERAYLQQDI